eukprot:Gb_25363 [translate_table: standard]
MVLSSSTCFSLFARSCLSLLIHNNSGFLYSEPSCDVAFVKKVEEIQHADPPKPREIPEFLRWRNSNQKSMSAKLRQRVPCGTPKVISMNGMHSPHRTCSDSITDIFDSQLTPSISSKENPGHSTENEVMPPKYVASLQGIHRGGTSEESSVMSSFSSWFSGSCCDSQNDWKGKTNTRFQDMRDRNFKLQSSKIETAGCKDVNREYGACESSRTMTSQNNDKAKECESSHNNTTDHCHYWPHETTRDNGATLAMNFVKGDNDVAQAKKLGVVSISDLSLDKIDADLISNTFRMSSDSSLRYWEDGKNYYEDRIFC